MYNSYIYIHTHGHLFFGQPARFWLGQADVWPGKDGSSSQGCRPEASYMGHPWEMTHFTMENHGKSMGNHGKSWKITGKCGFSINGGTPYWWMVSCMENPSKMDDLGI